MKTKKRGTKTSRLRDQVIRDLATALMIDAGFDQDKWSNEWNENIPDSQFSAWLETAEVAVQVVEGMDKKTRKKWLRSVDASKTVDGYGEWL